MGLFQSKFEIAFDGVSNPNNTVDDFFQVIDPLTTYDQCLKAGQPTDWVGLCNRVELRRGRKPGKAFVLLDYKTMKDIGIANLSSQGNDGAYFQFRITCQLDKNSPPDLYEKYGGSSDPSSSSGTYPNFDFKRLDQISFGGWFFLQAVAVLMSFGDGSDAAQASSGGGSGNLPLMPKYPSNGDIYLCEFGDWRCIAAMSHIFDNKVNIPLALSQTDVDPGLDPDDSKNYANCGGPTPNGIYGSDPIRTFLNNFPSFSGISDNQSTTGVPSGPFPTNPPISVNYDGVSCLDAYLHYLSLFNMTVGMTRGGSAMYTIQKGSAPGSSGGGFDAADRSYTDYRNLVDNLKVPIYSTSRSIQGTVAAIPNRIVVAFPTSNICGYVGLGQSTGCTQLYYPIYINTSSILPNVDTWAGAGGFGTTVCLVDYAVMAVFDFSPIGSGTGVGGDFTPTNLSDLTTRANARARAFLQTIYQQTNTADIIHGLWDASPSNDLQKIWYYDFGRGVHTQLFYGDDDFHEPFPKLNSYASPREFRADPLMSDRLKAGEFKGISRSRIRLFDAYIDDGGGSPGSFHSGASTDSPALVFSREQETVINGDVVGYCRLPDLVIDGTTCGGSNSGG